MAKSKDVIRQIKKATRRQFSAEDKIRIVLEGLRGETPISTTLLTWTGIRISSSSFLQYNAGSGTKTPLIACSP